MNRIVKLILVEGSETINHNKFYVMKEVSDTEFEVTWGRVGTNGLKTKYPIGTWTAKYNEKVKKGYTDVTEIISTSQIQKSNELVITDADVKALVEYLQSCAKQSIKDNYTVAIADVTQKQLDKAQALIDNLFEQSKNSLDVSRINSNLLDLYKTIPRKMNNTKYYLLNSADLDFFRKLLDNEQSLLDTLKTQVTTTNTDDTAEEYNLKSLGLAISLASQQDKDRIEAETDFRIGSKRVYTVSNLHTEAKFKKNNVKLFYHGSRNENWWTILQTGLKIRPTNAILTGSMFGTGIYFADKAQKSIGYTSLKGSHWSNGNSSKAYLAIFEVSVGKQWNVIGPGKRYESWMSSLNKKKVNDKGYDSLFAKGGVDLVNNEYVVFEEERCTIKYLIELTK